MLNIYAQLWTLAALIILTLSTYKAFHISQNALPDSFSFDLMTLAGTTDEGQWEVLWLSQSHKDVLRDPRVRAAYSQPSISHGYLSKNIHKLIISR